MHIRDFELERLPRGRKQSAWLDIAGRADGGVWRLPLLTVIGAEDGPTLLVIAGVHGDEYEGIAAIPGKFTARPKHMISAADWSWRQSAICRHTRLRSGLARSTV